MHKNLLQPTDIICTACKVHLKMSCMLVLLFIFATIDNAYLNVSDYYKSLLVVSSNFQMLK